ncbi:MAG: DUF1593 domain-containing protein [Bacteroidetes bacterium]|nr:MAG: DUF1593 domain-containing protein [Bacteroidota bacterium]
MKHVIFIAFFLLTALTSFPQPPRLLVTTDIGGDPDDQQSLVRLMVYSNEFEIEGIITSASGTPGELKEAIVRPDLVEEIIRGYQTVYPNLLKHDKNFPAPEYLLSVVKKGNPKRGWENVGEGNDTEGSEWIISQVDKKDKRPLNICIFGGQTDLAQALWNVKNNRSAKEYQQFLSKIRVYDINDQDKIFSQIFAEHRLPFYILAKAPEGVDKREGAYRGVYLGGDESLTSMEWLKENVLENHGPLGKLYPTKTWTAPNPHGVMKEGDTPSWFFFFENGLNIPDQPELGGWGGRFIKNEAGVYRDATDTFDDKTEARATVYRWRPDFQNDWAARMDWCVKNFDECNHAPVAVVNGSKDKTPLFIEAKSGKTITLDASESFDPDKHELSFEWLVYPETDDFDQSEFLKPDGQKAIIQLNNPNLSKILPVLLRVTDNGNPRLTAYKRIIFTVKK